MSKYGESIRRISRYEYLLKQIRQLDSKVTQEIKQGIGAKKGIAFLDKSTLNSISSAATAGASIPDLSINLQTNSNLGNTNNSVNGALSAAKNGTQQAMDRNNPNNGASDAGSTANLSSLDNTNRSGWYTADSILDGVKDSLDKEPPVPGDKINNEQYTGDTITALNGLASGARDMVVYLWDAASAYIAPADRADTYEELVDPTYTNGQVWSLISGGIRYFSNSFDGLIAIRQGLDGTSCYTVSGGLIVSTSAQVGGTLQFSGNHGGVVGGSAGALGGTVYSFKAYDGLIVGAGQYGQQPCGASIGDTAACSADTPYTSTWGDMGVTQLAPVLPATVWAGLFTAEYIGRFMPHPFDSNVPSIYQNGASVLDLETTGGKDIRIGPMRNGGWYMYERNISTGLPSAAATANAIAVIAPNKTLQGYITTNEWNKLKAQ